jgi:hypothetical protein
MDAELRARREASQRLVTQLIGRGIELSNELKTLAERGACPGADSAAVTLAADEIRAWQQDCAVAVNELSGLSKAHWLARAFSAAFLVPSTPASVVVEADVIEIVDRLLEVLQKAGASLQAMDDVAPIDGYWVVLL